MQLAQDVVRDVARGARLAVQEDRDVGVAEADFLDEGAQLAPASSAVSSGAAASSSSSIDRMKAEARLCCCAKRGQVAVAGDAQHLHALLLDRLGQRADAEAARVLGAEVFVDDDDGKTEAHGLTPRGKP